MTKQQTQQHNTHEVLGPYSISDIAQSLECELYNSAHNNDLIYGVNDLVDATSKEICAFHNIKYINDLQNIKARACILNAKHAQLLPNHTVGLLSDNVYLSYTRLIDLFYRPYSYRDKIESTASIASSAVIGKNCYIGHNVVIEDHVRIGDNCTIQANSFIGRAVIIGHRANIASNSSISHAQIGNDFVALPGVRIGQNGFGFATDKATGKHYRIYHIGLVLIGDDVEIGSNSTVDRGSTKNTIIESGCRIDNLVQIAHNVKIGVGSVVVAQVGIAGSSDIGRYCQLGGQVGVSGHIKINDFAQIAAKTGIIQEVEESQIVAGYPAVPIKDWHRQTVILKNLVKDSKNRN
ncbi:MAG: UDP-3-O-(3-hydroxymyristoyl)glucosamine N-acyltransferase [Rickettsiaceae bacterium]